MNHNRKRLLLSALLALATYAGFGATVAKVWAYEAQTPILIERTDNVLFRMRVEAGENQTLDEVELRFSDGVNLDEIAAVRLYYGGTECAERSGLPHYGPTDYISWSCPGKTLAANSSYSVLVAEAESPGRSVVLHGSRHLFPGVNYFWISLQMKPSASILLTVSAKIVGVRISGQNAVVDTKSDATVHYMAVGVRHAGDDGVEAYRIPGLATSNSGTLLGVYDVRYNGENDLQAHIDIGLSRSTDGGQTWEKMRIPMTFGEYGGLPKAQNGVGDPAILVDKQTGTIWIMAVWTHGMGAGRAWTASGQGFSIGITAQLMLTRSDDDGLTWSNPINITGQVKEQSWFLLLQGPGRGISMDDGTLVFACQYIAADRVPCAAIIYSKDHGATWKISAPACPNTTEAQVAEIGDGTLMLNMRDNRGGSRAVATTTDMGVTWHEHESSRHALQEPVCMASLISVKARDNALGRDILLFSNPNDSKARRDITIKASLDNGRTWKEENQLLLDSGTGWGYSCLTMIDRETVGILYESSAAQITFQAIKLRDIIASEY